MGIYKTCSNCKEEKTNNSKNYYQDMEVTVCRECMGVITKRFLSRPVQPQVIKKNAEGLLPCPFCGRKPRLEGTQPFLINEQKQTFRFICDCRCTVIDSVEKARDYWNKRK